MFTTRAVRLLAFWIFLPFSAFSTTLTGTFKLPDGTGANGYLYLSLSQQAALKVSCSGPIQVVPTYRVKIQVVGGALQSPPAIYGNDCLLPANTYYNMRFDDNNGNTLITDRWLITGGTVDIGTIVSVVISGTTLTLGNTGVVLLDPALDQTVTQPGTTRLIVNRFTATTSLIGPGGMDCDSGGCDFTSGAGFPNGVLIGASGPGTPVPTSNSSIFMGSNGNFWNRTFSAGDASCAGIDDGWMGFRTDTREIQMCQGGAVYKYPFASSGTINFNGDLIPTTDNAFVIGSKTLPTQKRVNAIYSGVGFFVADTAACDRFTASANEMRLSNSSCVDKWLFNADGTMEVQGLGGLSATLTVLNGSSVACTITLTSGIVTASTC